MVQRESHLVDAYRRDYSEAFAAVDTQDSSHSHRSEDIPLDRMKEGYDFGGRFMHDGAR